MNEGQNPREELYQRFRESLSKPVLERFFDEDELVEIYDYAGDLDDDYVQTEVLFCGARLYPESQPLAERRGLLYLDTSIGDSDEPSPAAGAFLDDNADMSSPLLDIARLTVNPPSDPEGALEFLVTQYNRFNDEEMIRFVGLAFDLHCYAWVVKNLERLRAMTDNPPILMYELVREADANLDNETMEMAADELIEAEPFNAGYWIALFKAQARAGKEEAARSTFDYAASLATDDTDSLIVLANDAYLFAPYLKTEAFDILEECRKKDPKNYAFTDMQVALLAASDMPGAAIARIKDFLTENPGDTQALRQLLRCNVGDCGSFIDAYIIANGPEALNTDDMPEFMSMLVSSSAYVSLKELVRRIEDVPTMQSELFCAYVEALFATGEYSEVVSAVESYTKMDEVPAVPVRCAVLTFAYMTSLMKTGRSEADALAFFESVRPLLEQAIVASIMPVRMCIRLVFTLADKIRRHPASEKFYWECFDMLWYSKF